MGEGVGCTRYHENGRSHMTIDPRIPAVPGRRVFTDQTDDACTKREAPWGIGEPHEG